MKKVTIYILLFCCMLSFMPCHAEGPAESVEQAREQLQRLNIINEDSFSQEEIVYRCEAIVPIMKMIGLPEGYEDGNNFGTCLQPFSDVAKDRWNDENSPKNQYGIKVHYFGYLILAQNTWVAFGYKNNFSPYDAITAKETVAFMMRAIEEYVSTDLDEHYEHAKTCGLIQPTDRFYEDGEVTITPNELCVLLNRMLYQPCNLYVNAPIFYWGRDSARTKRYIDIVNGDFPEDGD